MKRADIVKEARVIHVAASALVLLAGALFIAWPGMSVAVTRWVLCSIFVAVGLARVLGYFANDLYRLAFQYDLALGVFCVIFAVLNMLSPDNIHQFIPYAVGMYVLMDALLKVQTAFDAKSFGMRHWVGLLISSAVLSLFGVFAMVGFTVWEPWFLMGIALVLDGVENIWNTMGTVRIRAKKESKFEDLL